MRIIKPGKPNKEKFYIGTCECGCKFEANANEVGVKNCGNGIYRYYAYCPWCIEPVDNVVLVPRVEEDEDERW